MEGAAAASGRGSGSDSDLGPGAAAAVQWRIVGSSTGALIASHIAKRCPGLIDSLILLSPAVDLAS